MAAVATLVESKMESDNKPFECTAPGCGQRFANNDHLESHKQKHQLTLKFGNIRHSDTLIADQTPTPTRFLKNLEEEGLFQDLENPFDQEFKKAAPHPHPPSSEDLQRTEPAKSEHVPVSATASVINRTSSLNGTANERVIVIEHSNLEPVKSVAVQKLTIPSTPAVVIAETPKVITQAVASTPKSSTVSVLVRVPPYLPSVIPAAIANRNLHVPSALPVPGHLSRTTSQSRMPISIPTPAIVSSPTASHSPPFIPNAKQRLKEQLQQLHQNNNTTNMNIISQAMTEAVDMVTIDHHNGSTSHLDMDYQDDYEQDYQQDYQQGDYQQGETKRGMKRPRRSQEELDPDERRRKFLERNRAAATRCREKRKIWVQQLEKKADDLSETNTQLQSEISLLRSEVAQLKSLLLAHKDCPVTLAQQKMGGQMNTGVGQVHVTDTPNGVALTVSNAETSAEDVATSALTQMAHRATMELESYNNSAANGSWGHGE